MSDNETYHAMGKNSFKERLQAKLSAVHSHSERQGSVAHQVIGVLAVIIFTMACSGNADLFCFLFN